MNSDLDASWKQLAAALDRIYGPATAKRFQQAVGLLAGIILVLWNFVIKASQQCVSMYTRGTSVFLVFQTLKL